jgi:hypothetical protein
MRRRLRYIELKTGYGENGPASIGWVSLSKTGRTLYYRDLTLERVAAGGDLGHHRDVQTGDEYWVSGIKRNRRDRRWVDSENVVIDEDAREEYERAIGGRADS